MVPGHYANMPIENKREKERTMEDCYGCATQRYSCDCDDKEPPEEGGFFYPLIFFNISSHNFSGTLLLS